MIHYSRPLGLLIILYLSLLIHKTYQTKVSQEQSVVGDLDLIDIGLYPSEIGQLYTVERVVALHVHYKIDRLSNYKTITRCQNNSSFMRSLEEYVTNYLDEFNITPRNQTRKKRFISAIIGIISGAVGIGIGVKNYITESNIEAELERLRSTNEQLQRSNELLLEEVGRVKAAEELMIIKQSNTLKAVFNALEDLTCEVNFMYDNVIRIIDFIIHVREVFLKIAKIHNGDATADDLVGILSYDDIYQAVFRSHLLGKKEIDHSIAASTLMSGHWSMDGSIYSFIVWLPICKGSALSIYHFHNVGYRDGGEYFKCSLPHHLVIQHRRIYQIQVGSCVVKNIGSYFCPSYAKHAINPFSRNTLAQYCHHYKNVNDNLEIILTREGILLYTGSDTIHMYTQDESGFEHEQTFTNQHGTFFIVDENVTSIVADNQVVYQRVKLDKTLYIPHLVFQKPSSNLSIWNDIYDLKEISSVLNGGVLVSKSTVYISDSISWILSILALVATAAIYYRFNHLINRVRHLEQNEVILVT